MHANARNAIHDKQISDADSQQRENCKHGQSSVDRELSLSTMVTAGLPGTTYVFIDNHLTVPLLYLTKICSTMFLALVDNYCVRQIIFFIDTGK